METKDKIGASLPKLAFTRIEAAKVIGISAPTIDRLTKRGLLNPSRATRRPLYSLEEIQRFLRDTTQISDWSLQ